MSVETFDRIMDAALYVVLGLAVGILLSSGACASVGRCVFPPHADLRDPGDFDPKCLLDDCGRDAGP